MHFRTFAPILACSIAFSSPALANDPRTSPERERAAKTPALEHELAWRAPQQASESGVQHASAREVGLAPAHNEQGGAGMVIGASAATVILAIILLVVLL